MPVRANITHGIFVVLIQIIVHFRGQLDRTGIFVSDGLVNKLNIL